MNARPLDRRQLFKHALLSTGGFAALSLDARSEERATAHALPRLKITGVKTYLVEVALKRAFGVSVSVPLDKTRTALFVKVETDEGLVGWGETSPINGTQGTIDGSLRAILLGKNPLERRKLWREMWGANFGNSLAVGAVDMALDDLRGKALGMSVSDLYGGRFRDKVLAYASAMNYLEGMEPEDHYSQEASELAKQGFRALKMRLGRYSVNREAKVAAAVREAVGPDIKLMVDGNAAYTMGSALRMGHALHQLDFEFFEEPLPQSPNYAAYETLREKLPLPLAGGEAVDTRANARELIQRRTMDIIQPDISLCGGIGEVLFIAELAALSGIRCIPHCWGGAILIAATTHLVSLLPEPHWGLPTDTPMLELDQSENPWRTEIVQAPVQFKEGFVQVPTGPGLGIEVIEEAIERYAVK